MTFNTEFYCTYFEIADWSKKQIYVNREGVLYRLLLLLCINFTFCQIHIVFFTTLGGSAPCELRSPTLDNASWARKVPLFYRKELHPLCSATPTHSLWILNATSYDLFVWEIKRKKWVQVFLFERWWLLKRKRDTDRRKKSLTPVLQKILLFNA